jgi:hypothetical protein
MEGERRTERTGSIVTGAEGPALNTREPEELWL